MARRAKDERTGEQGSSIPERLIDTAVTVPAGRVHAYVDGLRRKDPSASPAELITLLEKRYLLAVSGSGAAVGAAAAFPVVGTTAAVALTAGQVGMFLAASSALTLAVADVHGIGVDDIHRRRALLMSSLLGEEGPKLFEQQLGLSSITWAKVLLTRLPVATVKSVNKALRGRVVKVAAAKGGSIMLGRLLPFGVGAVVGFAGGRLMGRTMIEGTRESFGPAPDHFTREVEGTAVTLGEDDLFKEPLPKGSGTES
ncbi:hypothetical protein EXU48_04695 [Occultella glacieicola]|uniref:Uncharacterized protein n=1 Tax=Occultella glacieicola TaxID=2518684 RepID=A0ABY2E7E7_9MICO|nr:hypothetical protein [Occultella glacieicola]TDE97491.1 hypothetical protein EXU48_04695 [Occultella glacieicola]